MRFLSWSFIFRCVKHRFRQKADGGGITENALRKRQEKDPLPTTTAREQVWGVCIASHRIDVLHIKYTILEILYEYSVH
ncbi:MAG: hypothetical protein ACI4V3_04530 [Faecousia sp.]